MAYVADVTSLYTPLGPPRHEVLKKDLGPDPALEEYLGCAIVSMSIYTLHDSVHYDIDTEVLLQYLKEQGIQGTFTLYYVSPQVLAEIDPVNPMKYEHADLPFLHREFVYTEPQKAPLDGLDWDMIVDETEKEYLRRKEEKKANEQYTSEDTV